MLEVKSEGVLIRLREPTIPERLRLMSKMGVSATGDVDLNLEAIANGIDNISHLVESVSVKIDGRVITTWEQLMVEHTAMPHAINAFMQVLNPTSEVTDEAKK